MNPAPTPPHAPDAKPASAPGDLYRITVKGRIAMALMPHLHGDELIAAANCVHEELATELAMAESQPDLLAACEAALVRYARLPDAASVAERDNRIDEMNALRAAIAKAVAK